VTVYEVQGWFGDHEWSEGLWASKETAEKVCEQLWSERKSAYAAPEFNGLCKFSVEEREVIV
jgi:hypothetical protein